MGRVEKGEMQLTPELSPVMAELPKPGQAAEYTIAVLRVLSRKDVGEPMTEVEREACRLALTALGRDWR